MDTIARGFPKGMEYSTIYNPTEFISQSIDAVYHTLFEAVVLVVLVILVFLQNWRAAIIPIIAIPVSLIGTALMLAGLGYSLNNLSLFGLVLAIGIVVDDAIVVVENVERNIALGQSPLEAARTSMDEVSTALVAIVLVLCAVFVPTLFITGLSGVLSPVCGDDLDGDRHLARPQPYAFARDGRAPAASWRSQRGERSVGAALAADDRACRRPVQHRVRPVERRICRAHATPAGRAAQGDRGLCRVDRSDDRAVRGNAERFHPGTGSGLFPRHRAIAAGSLARTHRCGDA
jgi:hypothetical protein